MESIDVSKYSDEDLKELFRMLFPIDEKLVKLPKFQSIEDYINTNPRFGLRWRTRIIAELIRKEGFKRWLKS